MGSVNVRKETNKLYLDFRYRNVRCREQTELKDTKANRKRLLAMLDKIEGEIVLGSFDYASTFPNSRMVKKFSHIHSAANKDDYVPLFKEFAGPWFEQMRVRWSESYQVTVEHIVFKRLVPCFGDTVISAITKDDILSFRVELMAVKKKNGKKLSASHVNRHLKILQSLLSEAAERFHFVSPYKNIKPLSEPKTDIQPFTPEEINLILNNVREDYRDYFTVRFFTGLRTGEVDGLKWQHVDLTKGIIKVRQSIVRGKEAYTKTHASQRDVQMNELVCEALKNMHARTGDHPYVFCTQTGNPLNYHNVSKRIWYPLLSRLGLKRRNPYQMRHTCATLWLASGEAPEWIARQLGHADTTMLFKVYSRFVPNLTRNDGAAANAMLSKLIIAPKKR